MNGLQRPSGYASLPKPYPTAYPILLTPMHFPNVPPLSLPLPNAPRAAPHLAQGSLTAWVVDGSANHTSGL